MPTNDAVDPSVQEADLRAARAKESLLSRVELLKRRISDARHRFNPQEQIAKHPIPAVGMAFALGVIAGLGRSRGAMPGETRNTLAGAAFAALTTVTLRILREVALTQLGHAAHDWWTSREGIAPEVHGSRVPDVEPFLEH